MGFAFAGDDTQDLEVRVITQVLVTLVERDNQGQWQVRDPIFKLARGVGSRVATGFESGDDDYSHGNPVVGS